MLKYTLSSPLIQNILENRVNYTPSPQRCLNYTLLPSYVKIYTLLLSYSKHIKAFHFPPLREA